MLLSLLKAGDCLKINIFDYVFTIIAIIIQMLRFIIINKPGGGLKEGGRQGLSRAEATWNHNYNHNDDRGDE